MHHGPAVELGEDKASASKSKVGISLLFVYCAIYVGFVAINTLSPATMEMQVFAGLNLAVVYGFGLIILAIVMGLVYNMICSNLENKLNPSTEEN